MWYGVMLKYFILPLIWCATVTASGIGRCPPYRSMDNFNISKFSGEWFEVERSFYLYEISYGCTSLNFELNSKKNLDINGSTKNRWNGKYKNLFGTAISLFPSASVFRFKPNTNMPFVLARLLPGAGIYSVLYTDYENIAIVWSCTSLLFAYNDRIWIFGREANLTEETRILAYDKVKSFNLDPKRLIVSKNKNC